VDWNDDGLEDIIVGDRNGYINYFRRTGSGIHDLTDEGRIESGGSAIDVGSNGAPCCNYIHSDGSRERLDWNEDGLCDMLAGMQGSYPSGSNLRIYLNEGTNADPVFDGYSNLPGDWPYRLSPRVADMNGDGKKDVLAGNYNGTVVYYENIGTNASPQFGSGENLEADGADIDLGYSTSLWVDDWNGDGLLDLLVSDYDGWVYLFLQEATGIAGEATAPAGGPLALTAIGNPCRGEPAVSLSLPSAMEVDLAVYDCCGRMVGGASPGELSAGRHVLDLPVEGVSSGVLFVTCRAEGSVVTERITLLAP
jgi:hypothetical protein